MMQFGNRVSHSVLWDCIWYGIGFILPCNRLFWWLSGKESACQCRRYKFDPWVRKIPWRRKWQPTLIFLPGKSRRQRNLEDYSPRGHEGVEHDLVIKQQQQQQIATDVVAQNNTKLLSHSFVGQKYDVAVFFACGLTGLNQDVSQVVYHLGLSILLQDHWLLAEFIFL